MDIVLYSLFVHFHKVIFKKHEHLKNLLLAIVDISNKAQLLVFNLFDEINVLSKCIYILWARQVGKKKQLPSFEKALFSDFENINSNH